MISKINTQVKEARKKRIQKKKNVHYKGYMRQEETFGGDENVYLDYVGFKSVYSCQNSLN